MPFDVQSLEAQLPSIVATETWRRPTTRSVLSEPHYGSSVPIVQSTKRTEPPPISERLWRALVSALSQAATAAMEGFAAYGEAMYPGFSYRDELDGDHRTSTEVLPWSRLGDDPCRGAIPSSYRGSPWFDDDASADRCIADAPAGPQPAVARAAAPAAAPGRRARIVSWFAGFWSRARRETEVHRTATLLKAFDDRLLRDIGVSRDQIDVAARYGDDRE